MNFAAFVKHECSFKHKSSQQPIFNLDLISFLSPSKEEGQGLHICQRAKLLKINDPYLSFLEEFIRLLGKGTLQLL